MRILRAHQLKEMMDRNPNLLLVNALERDAYEREHILASFNLPVTLPDLEGQADLLAADVRDRAIVVYCSGEDCPASHEAAMRLEASGFSEVYHFPGGMAEWKAAQYRVEGTAVRRRVPASRSRE